MIYRLNEARLYCLDYSLAIGKTQLVLPMKLFDEAFDRCTCMPYKLLTPSDRPSKLRKDVRHLLKKIDRFVYLDLS